MLFRKRLFYIICVSIIITLSGCKEISIPVENTATQTPEQTQEIVTQTPSPSPAEEPTPSPTAKNMEDIYKKAVRKYNKGNIWLAQEDFNQIQDYKDSNEYIKKINFVKQLQGTWGCVIYFDDGDQMVLNDSSLVINGLNIMLSRSVSADFKVYKYKNEYYLSYYCVDMAFTLLENKIIEYDGVEFNSNEEIKAINDEPTLTWVKVDDETTVTLKVEPYIGMTREELENDCTWGNPKDINVTTTAYGTREQWCYSGYRYVYLEDDIVTTIQE